MSFRTAIPLARRGAAAAALAVGGVTCLPGDGRTAYPRSPPPYGDSSPSHASCSSTAARLHVQGDRPDGAGGVLLPSVRSEPFPQQLSPSPQDSFRPSDALGEMWELSLATSEAALRAVRLASTAAAMAADYGLHRSASDPDSVAGRLRALLGGDDGEGDGGRGEMERKVRRLEEELAEAQLRYVTPDDGDGSGGDDEKAGTVSKKEQKEAMHAVADELAGAQAALSLLSGEAGDGGGSRGVHRRNADRLLRLCRANAGVYVKVGQHLANLDLLLPDEYIATLAALFDDAPESSPESVREVIREELGGSPDELFDDFSERPFASASLAQVHTAYCKSSGKKLAIKVQHRGLRETSRGDLIAMTAAVRLAELLFDDFNLGWLVDEIAPHLPRELDFNVEADNAERASAHLSGTGLDCVVPRVLRESTTERVLCMEFEEAFNATDVGSIDAAGLCRREVAGLITSVFNSQIFESGFVHCDPHEANVLVREHPARRGRAQLVLVDHGLYRQLDGAFRDSYARLWKGMLLADIDMIRTACGSLGVHEMYPLLSAMLTSRPFDEVIERSKSGSFETAAAASSPGGGGGGGDQEVIRGYAQRYLRDIIDMLDVVPRQMLLIFKMNDCLRHLDMALGCPGNPLVTAGRYASRRVLEGEVGAAGGGWLRKLRSWLSYLNIVLRIEAYDMWTRLGRARRLRLG